MYAIQITVETREFVARFFNDGRMPKLEAGNTFFVFGDATRPNQILTQDEFTCLYGNKMLLPAIHLYKVI